MVTNGPKFRTSHFGFQHFTGSRRNHSTMISCLLISDTSLCCRWEVSHPLQLRWHSAWDAVHTKNSLGGCILAGSFPARSVLQSVSSHSHINISTITKELAAKVQEESWLLSARHWFTAYLQPLYHRQINQRKRARRCRRSYGCQIKGKQFWCHFTNLQCKITWANLGNRHPLPPIMNNTAELGRDQKYVEIMKKALKKHFRF